MLYQAGSLAEFLEDLFKLSTPPHESPIDDVHEERLFQVWRRSPGVPSQEDCVSGADPQRAAFAKELGAGWSIVDLREPKTRFGFSWGRYGPKTELRRHGLQPIFAYRRPPSVVGKLFGKKR